MFSIDSNNIRNRTINSVLESLEFYRFNPEITFMLVGDYYPFMVKDHVLNILTDPLGNYTLVELCIQNFGDQKYCSSACYHHERSSGNTFRTYNPLYQFVRFKDIQAFKDYCYYTRCILCGRFLTKGVDLQSNPFPTSIDSVPVPVTYSEFFVLDRMRNISHK
ncbi:unnamed protein product [Macrosiphum euphorbiae]|uniref:Uncharacterized protein n=1 Tax=Macrosiphum euphorbiae TaxID=13131 RepID=A0AAV0XG21_9HEMI|nr:unnamed protein product [Macrosiphum euphorbiae]